MIGVIVIQIVSLIALYKAVECTLGLLSGVVPRENAKRAVYIGAGAVTLIVALKGWVVI